MDFPPKHSLSNRSWLWDFYIVLPPFDDANQFFFTDSRCLQCLWFSVLLLQPLSFLVGILLECCWQLTLSHSITSLVRVLIDLILLSLPIKIFSTIPIFYFPWFFLSLLLWSYCRYWFSLVFLLWLYAFLWKL